MMRVLFLTLVLLSSGNAIKCFICSDKDCEAGECQGDYCADFVQQSFYMRACYSLHTAEGNSSIIDVKPGEFTCSSYYRNADMFESVCLCNTDFCNAGFFHVGEMNVGPVACQVNSTYSCWGEGCTFFDLDVTRELCYRGSFFVLSTIMEYYWMPDAVWTVPVTQTNSCSWYNFTDDMIGTCECNYDNCSMDMNTTAPYEHDTVECIDTEDDDSKNATCRGSACLVTGSFYPMPYERPAYSSCVLSSTATPFCSIGLPDYYKCVCDQPLCNTNYTTAMSSIGPKVTTASDQFPTTETTTVYDPNLSTCPPQENP